MQRLHGRQELAESRLPRASSSSVRNLEQTATLPRNRGSRIVLSRFSRVSNLLTSSFHTTIPTFPAMLPPPRPTPTRMRVVPPSSLAPRSTRSPDDGADNPGPSCYLPSSKAANTYVCVQLTGSCLTLAGELGERKEKKEAYFSPTLSLTSLCREITVL